MRNRELFSLGPYLKLTSPSFMRNVQHGQSYMLEILSTQDNRNASLNSLPFRFNFEFYKEKQCWPSVLLCIKQFSFFSLPKTPQPFTTQVPCGLIKCATIFTTAGVAIRFHPLTPLPSNSIISLRPFSPPPLFPGKTWETNHLLFIQCQVALECTSPLRAISVSQRKPLWRSWLCSDEGSSHGCLHTMAI